MSEPLYLCRLDVSTHLLLHRARSQGLPLREVDIGYLFHSWLEAAFGPGVLRPFWVQQPEARCARLLAYTSMDADALRRHADMFALPDVHAAADWSTLYTKAMPVLFPQGTQLGFQVRLCPTVRSSGEKDRERDAFRDACLKNPQDTTLEREQVYRDWLEAWFSRQTSARLLHSSMTAFRLSPLLRRTQGADRRSHILNFPDVLMHGAIEVTDATAFPGFLRGGVGRHRAFGFGMLLLVPPSR